MVDFASITFEANTGSNAGPTWTNILGANKELRYHDTNAAGLATASASWPAITRPAATANVPYAYAYTADAVGLGVLGSAGAPTAFSNANYLWGRWHWDNLGTFAAAPVFSAYPTTAHGAITRGDGSILGGHASDTGPTPKSYIKANAFGRVGSAGAPAASPSNAPAVTDGTVGSVSPSAGANWLTNYQSMMGNNDWITSIFTPAATADDTWYVIVAMFTGPFETTGTLTPVLSLVYTYT